MERFRNAAEIYTGLEASLLTCQEHVGHILAAFAAIEPSESERKKVTKMLNDIHSKAEKFQVWIERNKIKEQDPHIFKKKFRAAFGKKLREIEEAIDKLYTKMKWMDDRVAILYRRLTLDITSNVNERVKRLEDMMVRIEANVEQLVVLGGGEIALPPYPSARVDDL
ncbi:uncharacterized protein BDR25DRAFT_112237 [Lindgomyces ingoldianus]|uniref:Uncharacterized protein n=1 Tax=Lindgomyces ingoldianus TaxID=673940 RepID=A0ACB6R6C3_9PLEO|nr:uncharacterized protein BDR25DRAFT_112237 [Lindgomyces ingoldianus]KAF2474809.1 hypothetical protein BDR25DRAFT_112237 [Lindgomyces ingoldianus]